MAPERYVLAPRGQVPNHPDLPALLYRAAFAGQTAAQIETALAEHDWHRSWRNGIYSFHHYHSTAHEVLVVVRGQARVVLGGPGGTEVHLGPGDTVVLPAGTGHCNVGSSADLLVVGAYAAGRGWDLCRPEDTDPTEARRRMAEVPAWKHLPVAQEETGESPQESVSG